MKTFCLLIFAACALHTSGYAQQIISLEIHAVAARNDPTAKEYKVVDRDLPAETLRLEPTVLLDQTAVASAALGHHDKPDAASTVVVQLTPEGRQRWGELTTKYLNQRLAIVLDGQLRLAPIIRRPMFNGSVEILVRLTEAEAEDVVNRLNRGAAK